MGTRGYSPRAPLLQRTQKVNGNEGIPPSGTPTSAHREGKRERGDISPRAPLHWRTEVLREAHQRLSHAQPRAFAQPLVQGKAAGSKYQDRGAVLEPAHFRALLVAAAAADDVGPAVAEVQAVSDHVQADARHQHRGHRDQGERVPAPRELHVDRRAFVLAEELLDAFQRDRIDVPGVPREVGDSLHAAVVRRVETVVHVGGDAQRDVAAVAVAPGRLPAHQVAERVGKALGLPRPRVLDHSRRAHDAVARTDDDPRVRVHRARAVAQLADEAFVQAAKARGLRFVQIEVGEYAPGADREIAYQGLLDAAEPAHETRGEMARDAVGDEEIDVLLPENEVEEVPQGPGHARSLQNRRAIISRRMP